MQLYLVTRGLTFQMDIALNTIMMDPLITFGRFLVAQDITQQNMEAAQA